MSINPTALSIRAKKLGVLIRRARLSSGKSLQECAQVLGLSEDNFEKFEIGDQSPSLPELEVLAFTMGVPVDQFLEGEPSPPTQAGDQELDMGRLIALRQRVIGASIRKTRLEAGLSAEELAEKAWTSASLVEAYELGQTAIPVPDLEVISSILGRSIRDFQDQRGPVGKWLTQQRAIKDFLTLPPDLQTFVSKPVNRPYLELAQRLSGMSVDKLRAVAEGLLEITL
jgi:transcriptional regulator with XRE-family HTH domain